MEQTISPPERSAAVKVAGEMDFLPYPEEPAQPGIEVPFLCSDENRQRYALLDIETINVTSFFRLLLLKINDSRDDFEVAVLAQAYIYFPILRQLVGESFNVQDFITPSTYSPGDQVITLRKLSKVYDWDKRWFFDRDEVFDELLDDLSLGYRPAFDSFLEVICPLEALGSPCNFIGFSILVLLWSISPKRMSEFRIIREGINHSWLERRLTAVGWCPYWTRVYAQKLSPFMLYYLSGMLGSRHASHEGCEPNKPCSIYDVDYRTYRTKHAPDCDGTGCAFRGVEGKDLERLASIISHGAIPLIRLRPINDLPGAHVEVELVEHRYGKPFIAISHVWSGGLGHFSANTLPQCQLHFLYLSARLCKQKLYGENSTFFELFNEETTELIDNFEGVRPLYPVLQALKSIRWLEETSKPVILGATGEDISAVHLWIDTLCIPADPNIPDQRTVQKNAIDSMALVYSMAMQVLVIDQSVKEVSLDSESGLRIAAELLTSSWMTRSWTYQEGSLSREISFLLKNGFANPRRQPFPNLGSTIAKKQSTFEKALMAEFLREVNNIPDVLNLSVTGASRRETALFIQIWNELATRRTSMPDDLHGLLAVLLGLSAHEILGPRTQICKAEGANAPESQEEDSKKPQIRSPAERMLAVYRAQPSLPMSMLLIPFPPNTPMCNGNEWMPRFPAGSLDLKFGMMRWKCGEEVFGLSISLEDSNLWGLITECGIEDLSDSVFPIPVCSLSRISSNGEHKLDCISVRLHPPSANTIRRVPPGSQLCLLIHHSTYHGCCLFLSDNGRESGLPLYLNFLCPLTYQRQFAATSRRLPAGSGRVILPSTHFVTSRECILNCGKAGGGAV